MQFLRCSLLLSALGCLFAVPAVAELRAGAAQVQITPPEGIAMAGYYQERGSEGVHDDLFARALVFEESGSKAVLVTLDLITTTMPLVEASRSEISKLTGIPGERVLITASHTHTAPVITGRGPRDAIFGGGKGATVAYNVRLPFLIAECVAQADARLAPAVLAVGSVMEKRLAFNRRFFMKDGSVSWNPRKLDPDIVEPAGPVDPEVQVLVVNNPQGRAIATLAGFALHPDTVGGTRISADFPGVMANLVGAWRGGESVTLFANGACGNINHRDVRWDNPQKGIGEATRIGAMLAGDVFTAVRRQRPVAGAGVRSVTKTVELPLPPITPEEVRKATETLQQMTGAEKKPAFLDQVSAFKVADIQGRNGQPWKVEVQVIALGDAVAMVSLPGEIFVELGLAIKKRSPFKHTFVVELANGSIGYVPDRRAYGQGQYEVVSARVAPGSGELLVEAAVAMLEKLRAERQ